MRILRQSTMSGKMHQMNLNVTKTSLLVWNEGVRIQNVFPFLTPSQREFLISGSTDEEFALFGIRWDLEEIMDEIDEEDQNQIVIPDYIDRVVELIKRYDKIKLSL